MVESLSVEDVNGLYVGHMHMYCAFRIYCNTISPDPLADLINIVKFSTATI